MSIAVSKWALRQDLKPVPKFVLVVLADAANDQGICWPCVATIAGAVGVSKRTVQRAIQLLINRELITAEQRYRSDGSCSSMGVTDCHRPLTVVTLPPDTRARVPLTPVSYQEPP